MTVDPQTSAGDLRLAHLTKTFGALTAVEELDLTVPQGSFFALLGASGCGKTTTLRMVAGLEEPTRGRVLLGDRDITRLRPYKRPVNTVFQSYALFPHLDVFENVAFGLRRRGIRSVDGQVRRMLSLVQLDGYERHHPAQLSGGQQQRVALARALVNHPQVLLLDEPLGALDVKLRRRMQLELKRIQTEVGITFVHVTHDQEEAMTMADTVAVMNAGRIEQLGAPAEIYEFPATAFVATFLGQSNLIAGDVSGGNGGDLLVDRVRHAVLGAVGAVPRRPGSGSSGRTPGEAAPGRGGRAGARRPPACRRQHHRRLLRRGEHAVPAAYRLGTELSVFVANSGAQERFAVGERVVAHWDPRHAFLLGRQVDEDDRTAPMRHEPVGASW